MIYAIRELAAPSSTAIWRFGPNSTIPIHCIELTCIIMLIDLFIETPYFDCYSSDLGSYGLTTTHLLGCCGVFATIFPAPGLAQTAPNTLCLPTGTVAAWRSNALPIVSPDISFDMKVTLRLCAPDAHTVRVFGDWNQSSADGSALSRDGHGVWSTSVGPVKPDLYQYYFTVDGVKTIDPANVHSGNDAVRITSYFIVSGDDFDTALYESRNVPHGDVISVWYPSKTISTSRRALIYTPPDYRASKRRYPVLYLFHGWGGDENEGSISAGSRRSWTT